MRRTRTVAVIALAAVLGLAVAGYAFAPESTEKQMTVTAQFEDAVGLYEGNAVAILGMRIGTVKSIVSKGTHVDVELAIDKGVDIPADVQAVTVNTSILTDRHVELTPPYHGGAKLTSHDIIGLSRTRTPVEFDRTLAMVDKLAVALQGDGKGQGPLADFIATSNAAITGNGQNLKATLDQLSAALRLGQDNGAQTSEAIRSIVDNLAELTRVASENDATLRDFGSNLHKISDILADERLGSGTTGKKANEVLSIVASLLENNRDRLKGTVADATNLTTTMVDMRRETAEAFDLAPLVADNTYNTIDTNAGAARAVLLPDKMMFQSQMTKELCNLINKKQLGCATGTARDFGPDFGLSMMLDLMAEGNP